jgi:hypothetical protein
VDELPVPLPAVNVPAVPPLLELPAAPRASVPAVALEPALEEAPPEPLFVGGESLHAGSSAKHKAIRSLGLRVAVI